MGTALQGTADAICERLNTRDFAGGSVHAQGGHALTLWLGVCCEMCDDAGVELTFRGVTMTAGLAEARAFDRPHFRLATDDEQNERELFAERDEAVYCVESRDAPADAPRLFVVTRSVELDMNHAWAHDGRAPSGTLPPRGQAMDGQAACDEANAWCYGDWHIHARGDDALTLWIGDCCELCSNPLLVTFRDITLVKGLEHGCVFAVPWLRFATDAECREHAREPPADTRAFCIEPKEQRGQEAPRVFIVARAIEVIPPEEIDYTAIARDGRAARGG